MEQTRTQLPWVQYSIVTYLALADSLAQKSIHPIAPQLIRDIGITHGNESQVGYYVGLFQSLFYFTQAMFVAPWSAISDRVGRKPVLLIGLAGLSISMGCLGLSKTYMGLVMSQCLNGVLNGNVGVLKSVLIEITDETNRSQAYAYGSISLLIGDMLGPTIGGSLAHPAEQFPILFGNNEFLKKYPYFPPFAVSATFAALALPLTFRFMKETVPDPQSFCRIVGMGVDRRTRSNRDQSAEGFDRNTPPPLRNILTSRVVIAVASYGCIALVDNAFSATWPLFFSTPIELGGLGIPISTIGKIFSISGVLNGFAQILFFAQVHDYWGSKTVCRAGIALMCPAIAAFPLMNYIAKTEGLNMTVWFLIALQIVLVTGVPFLYGAIYISIGEASPSQTSLGATYGLSQVFGNIMRALGRAGANSLFSLSIEKNYLRGNLVYCVLLATGWVSMMVVSRLPENSGMHKHRRRRSLFP